MRAGRGTTRLPTARASRSEEHTSELQSRPHLVCRLLLEKKKKHMLRNLNHVLWTSVVRARRSWLPGSCGSGADVKSRGLDVLCLCRHTQCSETSTAHWSR